MSNQEVQVKRRIESFLKEYGELVKKHRVDYATFPMFIPDGQGGFKIVVQSTPVDMDDLEKKSPEPFIK